MIIDIAVPRDVDAATKSLPDVTLYDIDDLEQVAEANLKAVIARPSGPKA
jgi:glutamyl-tRNA reductase